MKFARLRKGEILAGIGGLALLVFMFALPWLSTGPAHATNVSGWTGLPALRWVLVVTGLVALALTFTQATRPAPAIPVTLSVYVTVAGFLSTVLLALRLITTGDGVQAGAILGLLAAVTVMVGGFVSLRQEDGFTPGPEHPIETISLRPTHRS